jgi:K+-sensing histidine kinase KdpD
VIDDILDFSKIESGKLDLEAHPFSLVNCIEDALDLLAGKAAEKGLELAYMMDERRLTPSSATSPELRQILVNLISNAVKFTRMAKSYCRSSQRAPRRYISTSLCGAGHRNGLSPDKIGLLFPFVQPARFIRPPWHSWGTGLGLESVT